MTPHGAERLTPAGGNVPLPRSSSTPALRTSAITPRQGASRTSILRWLEAARALGGPITIAFMFYGSAYFALAFGPWTEASQVSVITNVGLLPIAAASVWMLWRTARHPANGLRTRRAWLLLSFAFLAVASGDLSWVYVENMRGEDPSASLINLFYIAFYPLALAGLLVFPKGLRGTLDRVKFGVDCLTVTLGGAILIWHFVLQPALFTGDRAGGLTEMLLTVSQPVGDMLVLFGVATVLLRLPRGPGRRTFIWLIAGLTLLLVGDSLWAYLAFLGDYETGGWSDVLWYAFYLCAIAAAEFEQHRLTCLGQSEQGVEYAPSFTQLPYASVLLGYMLLVAVTATEASQSVFVLVIAAGGFTALVSMRQIIALNEKLLAQRAALASEARLSALVENASDAILILDSSTTISYASPSVSKLLGTGPEQVLGSRLTALLHPDERDGVLGLIAQRLSEPGSTATMTWRLRHSDAHWMPMEIVLTNMLGNPVVDGLVINMRDVTERLRLEDQLRRRAFQDPLTGLANRTLFLERLDQCVARAAREKCLVAVLFFDLDHFKAINDSLGHAQGDLLLKVAAKRLQSCLKAIDTAARLGGDEFAVLLEDIQDIADAVRVAQRIVNAFDQPFLIDGREVLVTASLGIVISSGEDAGEILLRNADLAMYSAKNQGRGRYALFEAEMHQAVLEKLELQAEMRMALEHDEFVLHYQPIVETTTGQVYAVEALLRWPRPGKPQIPPLMLIPLAESSGLIVALGQWALRRALDSAQRWSHSLPVERKPVLTVNLSGRQIQDPGLVEYIAALLAESRFPPQRLVLEITETVLMKNTEAALKTMQALKALGIRLAIDDFGTGYSSLSYLQKFPLDVLKIPREFVEGLHGGKQPCALAKAILALAETLQLRAIAEGVETLEEVEALRRIGCEFMQGYYFARPLGEAEVADLLVQNLVHGLTLPITAQGSPLLEAALHRERRAAHR